LLPQALLLRSVSENCLSLKTFFSHRSNRSACELRLQMTLYDKLTAGRAVLHKVRDPVRTTFKLGTYPTGWEMPHLSDSLAATRLFYRTVSVDDTYM